MGQRGWGGEPAASARWDPRGWAGRETLRARAAGMLQVKGLLSLEGFKDGP